jgi:hypothetical protein
VVVVVVVEVVCSGEEEQSCQSVAIYLCTNSSFVIIMPSQFGLFSGQTSVVFIVVTVSPIDC